MAVLHKRIAACEEVTMETQRTAPEDEILGIDYFLNKISQHYPPRDSEDELLLAIYEQLCEKHFGSIPRPLRADGRVR